MNDKVKPNLSEYVATLIRVKARKLQGCAGFRKCDIEDIEQELALHVLQKLDQHDPDRGTEQTFVSRIVDRKIASMIRYQRAHRRRYDLVVDQADVDDENCREFECWDRSPDLAIDLAEVVNSWDENSKSVITMLMTKPATEVARRLGVTRAVIRSRIRAIRERMSEAGLDQYMDEASP